MLSKYAQNVFMMVFVLTKNKNTLVIVLRATINFVTHTHYLRAKLHSGDKALTQLIWVFRKPTHEPIMRYCSGLYR